MSYERKPLGTAGKAKGGHLWLDHRTADRWVDDIQKPLDQQMGSLLDEVERERAAGTLTQEKWDKYYGDYQDILDEADFAATEFSVRSGSSKTIIDQWRTGDSWGNEAFRKQRTDWFDAIKPPDPHIDDGSETKPPGPDPDRLKKAEGAAEQQRKRALGAMGRSSTILTRPQPSTMLTGGGQRTPTTLLGY